MANINLVQLTLNYVRTVPEILAKIQRSDNLEKVCDILRARIYNMGFQIHTGAYLRLYYACRNLSQAVYAIRIFKTPALLLHTVNAESISRSDTTLKGILNILQRVDQPGLTGSDGESLHRLKQDPVKLESVLRESLDSLLIGEKSYTVKSFRDNLQVELARRLSMEVGKSIIVNLYDWKVPYKPRTYLELALVISRSITSVFLTGVFLQDWGLADFTKFGFANPFTRKGRGDLALFSLRYSCDAINYAFTALESLGKIKSLLDDELNIEQRAAPMQLLDQKIYQAWKFFISSVGSVLFTTVNYGIQERKFYACLQIFRATELIGDFCLKPRLENFRLKT